MELMQTIAGLPLLPHALGDIESKAILKQLPKAHAALAELKGVAASMPNQTILVGSRDGRMACYHAAYVPA